MSNFVLEIMKAVRQLAAAPSAETGSKASTSLECLTDAQTGTPPTAPVIAPPAEGVTATGGVAMVTGETPSERAGHRVDLVEGFLEWGVKYLLNNLARALDNDAFAPLVEQLQVSRQKSRWCCRCLFVFRKRNLNHIHTWLRA